jgi:FlaA1/EpsC-like NDP-sugar epimerase
MARGGELFVLDMGEPVRIHDLAVKMIHLHGKEVALADSGNDESIIPRIEIEYVGLRPGEKLFEELIIGQSVSGTKHSKIMMAEEDCLPFEEMFRICEKLQVSCEISDYQTVKELLEKNVSGYAMYVTTSDPVMLLALEPSKANNVTPLVRNED